MLAGAGTRYTGHERDLRTGLDYMVMRSKAVTASAFLRPDLVYDFLAQSPPTWNLYAYAHSNPILLTDPMGLATPLVDSFCDENPSDVSCSTGVNWATGGYTSLEFGRFFPRSLFFDALRQKFDKAWKDSTHVEAEECFWVTSGGPTPVLEEQCKTVLASTANHLVQDALFLTTWIQNPKIVFDWYYEIGGDTRYYGPTDVRTWALSQSSGAQRLRDAYVANNCAIPSRYVHTTEAAFLETARNPLNGAQAQLGAWAGRARPNGNGTVTYSIVNNITMNSALYHGGIPHHNQGGLMSRGGTMHQLHIWTEKDPSGCQ